MSSSSNERLETGQLLSFHTGALLSFLELTVIQARPRGRKSKLSQIHMSQIHMMNYWFIVLGDK